MKKHLPIILIIILAFFLRFYQLGKNPPSLDWDEASLGYNAYSLLKTGRDEYGNSFPISLRSFNDYKPPLYVYLTVPCVAIFGLNEFAVRCPSAFLGTLSVALIYLIAGGLFRQTKPLTFRKVTLKLPEIAALLMAISPWSLQFSRVAFEANIALFFFLGGVLALVKGLKGGKGSWLPLSALSFTLSMYAYHSSRVTVPLFLVLAAILYFRSLLKLKKQVFLSLSLALLLLMPLAFSIIRGSAQARFAAVSIFQNPGIFTDEEEKLTRQEEYRQADRPDSPFAFFHHRFLVLGKIIAKGYFDHFNLDFLFLSGDGIGRHSASGIGLLYYWELPFLLAGFYYLCKRKDRAGKIIFPLLIVAPFASSLTSQTPHAVRSLLLDPVFQLVVAFGLLNILVLLKKDWLVIILGLVIIGNFLYYLDLYYLHTPLERSREWQYGYKQAVAKAKDLEDRFEEIIVTTEYDQPYIFFLFYNQFPPDDYQPLSEGGSAAIGKYHFRKIKYDMDKLLPGRLLIGSPGELPGNAEVLDRIYFLDGKEAFIFVKT